MKSAAEWLDLDHVEQKMCEIVVDQLGVDADEAKPESRLIEDLNCDSLDLIEMIMEIEDEFDITIPDNPATPVGKLIFTRTPFRLRDFAEFAFLNQGTGTPNRSARWKQIDPSSRIPEREFTQLGGRVDLAAQASPSLYETLKSKTNDALFRRTTDGMVCVQIPAIETSIGDDGPEKHDDEKPAHRVKLSSYLMDIEPVSVTAFCRFLNSIDATEQELSDLVELPENDDRSCHLQFVFQHDRWQPRRGTQMQPVVMVSFNAANAYSLWVHGRDWRDDASHASFLPSEAQWECAAKGAFDHKETVCAGRHERGSAYETGLLPIPDVQLQHGVSEFGIRHMSGTIWHWCCDWFDPDFYKRAVSGEADPVAMTPTNARSERGGSWVGTIELCRESYRRGRNPDARGRCLGFRCVGVPPVL